MPLRSRKKFRFWPFTLNLHGKFVPLPKSWGFDVMFWSWNSRTRRHRFNLPWIHWWESEVPRTWYGKRDEPKPKKTRASKPTAALTYGWMKWGPPADYDALGPCDREVAMVNGLVMWRHRKPGTTAGWVYEGGGANHSSLEKAVRAEGQAIVAEARKKERVSYVDGDPNPF